MHMQNRLSYLPLAAGFTVLVLSLTVGVLTVTTRPTGQGNSQNLATKAAEQTASLSLVPAGGDYTFSPTITIPVGIVLDSAGKSVDGVDVIIGFDPAKVQITGNKITPGTLFEEAPQNTVDNKLGQIRFSALTFKPKPVSGIVGTFSVKPLIKGEIDLTFQFLPGATTDSNIAEHGTAKDVLGRVGNGRYTFK